MPDAPKVTYKHLIIDTKHNRLLCDNSLVGIGELVEIFAPDDDTPPNACGKILRKTKDQNIYVLHSNYENAEETKYELGPRCVLRVVARNRSGTLRRKSSDEEKQIVNLEKNEKYQEKRVVRAKTGSVRKRKGKPAKKAT